MGALLDAVRRFFDNDDWTYQLWEEHNILQLGFQGQAGDWICYASTREELDQIMFYSRLPLNVPEDKRARVTEVVMRANFGLILGNFEMDVTDGELRFKTSVDVEGGALTEATIKNLVYSNVLTMDRYYPAIMGAMYSDRDPADLIAQVETPQTPAEA